MVVKLQRPLRAINKHDDPDLKPEDRPTEKPKRSKKSKKNKKPQEYGYSAKPGPTDRGKPPKGGPNIDRWPKDD